MITYLGWATLDGVAALQPIGFDGSNNPIYQVPQPRNFFLVVEAKPGLSRFDAGMVVFNWDPNDPTVRPDLQIQSTVDLGTGSGLGSTAVCDIGPAPSPLGGVPHIGPPPSFDLTQYIADELSDFGCRFAVHINQLDACTGDGAGAFFFANKTESKIQFCAKIDTALSFQSGVDTLITVQVLDAPPGIGPGDGSPGPPKSIVIRAP